MGKSRTRAAVSGVGASYVTKVLGLAIGFVVTPIVLGYLGRELYGFWVIVGSILGYLGVVDLGITGPVSTLIARMQADESGEARSAIASSSLAAHVGSGIVVALLGVGAGFLLPPILRVPVDQVHLVGWAVAVAGVALGISFPSRTLKAVLTGTQNIATVRIAEFALTLLRTAIILMLLAAGQGLMALPFATLVSGVVGNAVYYWLIARLVHGVRLVPSAVSWRSVQQFLNLSLWWFMGSAGGLLIYQTDNILLGRYLGPVAVTIYALTYRLPEMVRGLIYQLNLSVSPGVGDLTGRGKTERLGDVFISLLRVTFFMSISAAMLVVTFNRDVVRLWVGDENFAGQALVLVFALTLVYLVFFHTSAIVLTNHLELKPLAIVRFFEGTINLALSLLLVMRFGMIGIAAATLIAGLITSGWFVPYRACRLLHIDFSRLFREVFQGAALFTIMASLSFPVMRGFGSEELWQLLLKFLLLSIWLLFLGFVFLLPRGEIVRMVFKNARNKN